MDRHTFLENLRKSGLLTDQELRAAVKRLPQTDRGRVVARAFVAWGLLTKFQAELLLIGRTNGFTLGQYRILDQIGSGGMGRIFKARHQTMNRLVALKVLAPQFVNTERARQLFLREVQAAARLSHPNIVTAYDADEVNGRCYLVMEYVDGPNLDQLVRQLGPLPIGLTCDLVRQAAHGLQCAFALGMVHRDIKPANLLVQRPANDTAAVPCVVKILDFGLARLHAPEAVPAAGNQTILTRANTIMGTPDFVSPEQARDMHQVDIRSDLYSLGCTFYYLLTGRVPFPGGTAVEKLVRHVGQQPTPVEELRPEAPPGVAAIVRRLMAKQPDDRFQTPAELAAALAPYAIPGPAGATGSSPPVPPSEADALMAPTGDLAEASEARGAGGGGALDATLPPDLMPTPMSAENLPILVTPIRRPRDRGGRLRTVVVCAVGFLAALFGAIGALLLSR
jgi:serine/threonine-protein kinase